MSPKKIDYKGKIIFLHGYTQSSSVFYAKTSALRKKLTKLQYKSVYLNAPLKLMPTQMPSGDDLSQLNTIVSSDDEATNYRAWWVKTGLNNDSVNLDEAIQTIKNYVTKGEIIDDEDLIQEDSEDEKDLEVVGVIGFSQGACLGGLVAHKFPELFGANAKFFILYSGFKLNTSKKSGNEKYDPYYTTLEKPTPGIKYLHVYGELDTVIGEERTLSLYNITKDNSDVLKHPGGHFVPNSKMFIDQVTNWIQAIEKDEEKKVTKDDSDEIYALMDIMDSLDGLGGKK